MTGAAPHRKYTLEEFVELEQYSNVRHEFFAGQIYAMAGGTPEHGTYCANVIALLAGHLQAMPCRVMTSDVRIRVAETGLSTYPDVSVVYGSADRDERDVNAITNPVVLVEVLSPGTEEYDRGEKLEHYKRIPSLREVLFVAHDARRLEVHRRRPDGSWSVADSAATDAVRLDALGCDVPVAAVYRDPLATG